MTYLKTLQMHNTSVVQFYMYKNLIIKSQNIYSLVTIP